jgi:hypothetical protein
MERKQSKAPVTADIANIPADGHRSETFMEVECSLKLGSNSGPFLIYEEEFIVLIDPCHAVIELPRVLEFERDNNISCPIDITPLAVLICWCESLGIVLRKGAALTVPGGGNERTITVEQPALICDASNCTVFGKSASEIEPWRNDNPIC